MGFATQSESFLPRRNIYANRWCILTLLEVVFYIYPVHNYATCQLVSFVVFSFEGLFQMQLGYSDYQ